MKKNNKGSQEVAKLSCVKYIQNNDGTDEVLVTFKVIDEDYKSLVLQVARRDDIKLIIGGEKLYISPKEK
jgi:hypothetical protein